MTALDAQGVLGMDTLWTDSWCLEAFSGLFVTVVGEDLKAPDLSVRGPGTPF